VSDDHLIREVDEEVRRDRARKLFERYGPWLAGALAAVLLGVGGWRLFEAWSVQRARAQAEEFAQAQGLLRAGDAKTAATAFGALAGQGPAIYRDMAKMERAAALAAGGDLQGALKGFDAAAQGARDPIVRDMARLRAAYLAAETQDFPAVQRRLQPLIDAGGPISFLARELLGVEAWEAGRFDLARQTFESLSDAFQTPDSIRQRAQLALAVLGPGAPADAARAAPATGAPRAPGGDTK
jgi:hypothetical protein